MKYWLKDNGSVPSATDTVRVHYTGTLPDGTVFDSSVARGQPAEFPVNGVIKGWIEALSMMPVGSKWRLAIPHELAYGERGAGAASRGAIGEGLARERQGHRHRLSGRTHRAGRQGQQPGARDSPQRAGRHRPPCAGRGDGQCPSASAQAA